MAKVFIGIALVFMLVTAGIGFALKGNIDKLKTAYTATKSRITTAEAAAKTAKADADKAKEDLKVAEDKTAAAVQTAETKTKEAADSKQAADELKVVVEGKEKEIAELKKNSGANPNQPTQEMLDQVKAQLADATTAKDNAVKEKEEVKVALDAEVAKGKENEEKVHVLSKELHDRQLNIQKVGLQGRILAVNSGWNFAVLSVGDKQGVVVNATLLVVRGNEPIARLRVTSVEPSTSIADVLPGTVRKGTAVQPGDTVIFEGPRGQTPQIPKSAPETTPTVPPITPTTPALPNS